MSVLFLDGSTNDNFDMIHSLITQELEKNGFEVDSILLREVNVAACQGCFECWVKSPGECRTDDYSREISRKMAQSDLIIHFTPITFGGYSSTIKYVIDRFIPNILPFFTKRNGETHHKYRYKKRASIIAVGFKEESNEEEESTFKDLVGRNSHNMGAPIHEPIIYIKNQNKDDFINQFNNILKKVEVKI
ncbi:MAG: flavodoxin family protein [Candidatus Thorarchaeota archaeon]